MPKARLELAWAVARHPLKMVCLPVPPLRHWEITTITRYTDNQLIFALQAAMVAQVKPARSMPGKLLPVVPVLLPGAPALRWKLEPELLPSPYQT